MWVFGICMVYDIKLIIKLFPLPLPLRVCLCACVRACVCVCVSVKQCQNALVVASNFNQSHAGALLRKRGGREDTGGGYATGPVSSHTLLNRILHTYFLLMIFLFLSNHQFTSPDLFFYFFF